MDYEQKYKEALERAKSAIKECGNNLGRIKMIESIFPELAESEDERIRKELIKEINGLWENDSATWPSSLEKKNKYIAWLEKQGEKQQKTPIWKHWKDGIAGNGEGKSIYLIKSGNTYSLSSCLCFECDYIELSELDKLLYEKRGQARKITHEEICKSYGIPDIGEFSDGYHTFNGLYKQRMILFAVLVKTYKDRAWKSWKHEDGLDCFGGGWFIVGIDTPAGTYTYHYEAKDWDRFDCQILEKAKHWDGHDESDVERLFSLVSNTNKDEVIKCLINGMKFYYEDNEEATWGTEKFSMKVRDILSWLEKQGANSATITKGNYSVTNAEVVSHPTVIDFDGGKCTTASTTFEPKFHKSDWITNGDYTWKIVEVKPLDYILQAQDGNIVDDTISHVDEQFHSFTIEDAKDGDVLSDGTTIFIFEGSLLDGSVMSYCDYDTDSGESNAFCPFSMNLMCSKITPATKEQRDLLFQEMKESGYEWDAEKKELNKIEQKSAEDSCKNSDDITTEEKDMTEYKKGFERGKQRVLKYPEDFDLCKKTLTAWSEEDERTYKSVLYAFKHNYPLISEQQKFIKSLKDKVQQRSLE